MSFEKVDGKETLAPFVATEVPAADIYYRLLTRFNGDSAQPRYGSCIELLHDDAGKGNNAQANRLWSNTPAEKTDANYDYQWFKFETDPSGSGYYALVCKARPEGSVNSTPFGAFGRRNLRVLSIGNSFTIDATHYLNDIVYASGVDVSDICVYIAVKGGGSFKEWCDVFYDSFSGSSVQISKMAGALDADVKEGIYANGEEFCRILSNNKWDLITIQQRSYYAHDYESWETDGVSGHLSELLQLIRKMQPDATIGYLMPHALWGGDAANTFKSSYKWWEKVAESTKKLSENYGIDFIIPHGTAIQNLRASSLNNQYDLTEDGLHCANGLADYTAACTYFQSVFAPRYGVSVLGNAARKTVPKRDVTYSESDIDVTDANAEVAQKAAFLACCDGYKCVNPEGYDLGELKNIELSDNNTRTKNTFLSATTARWDYDETNKHYGFYLVDKIGAKTTQGTDTAGFYSALTSKNAAKGWYMSTAASGQGFAIHLCNDPTDQNAGLYTFELAPSSTAVGTIVTKKNDNADIYDLQGCRRSSISTPGLYIIDGNKVIVK